MDEAVKYGISERRVEEAVFEVWVIYEPKCGVNSTHSYERSIVGVTHAKWLRLLQVTPPRAELLRCSI